MFSKTIFILAMTILSQSALADSKMTCRAPGGNAGSSQMDMSSLQASMTVINYCPEHVVIKLNSTSKEIDVIMPLTSTVVQNSKQNCTYIGQYNSELYEADCLLAK